MVRPLLLLLTGTLGCRPPPAPGPVRTLPSPAADLIYLAMPDRFADGDPATPGAIDPSDPHGWHGGDLAGLTAHLDHLQALGVRSLWLTPVFEARDDKIDEWGAFHGYWVTGSGALNPRFGTEDELRALSQALHERGMRLVLDVVWNHTDYDAPVLADHPDWFHATGDIENWDDPTERVQGRVHGLPDLAQERPEVEDWLLAQTAARVRASGVDGLRVDAVGHMPLDFLHRANAHLDAMVEEGSLWTLGEDFTGDPARLARTLTEGGFDAVFDFPLHYALTDVVCRDAPLARLGGTLSLDRLYGPDPGARLVTFLDNHDLPRVMSACHEDEARVDRALALLFSLRGTPSLTWGTEALVAGAEEPHNRASLPWDQVDRRTEAIGALQALRAAHPALHRGQTRLLHWEPGLLVLGRWTDEDAALIRIHTNPGFTLYTPPEALVSGARIAARLRATDRLTVLPDEDAPVPAGLALRGTGVWVDVLQATAPGPPPWASWQPTGAPMTVRVRVPDAPQAGELRLVGAGPELGHWDPERGVRLVDGEAELELPAHSLALAKPVLRGPGGWTWADGADRVIAVDPERADGVHELRWRPAP
jgi:glycosidase